MNELDRTFAKVIERLSNSVIQLFRHEFARTLHKCILANWQVRCKVGVHRVTVGRLQRSRFFFNSLTKQTTIEKENMLGKYDIVVVRTTGVFR